MASIFKQQMDDIAARLAADPFFSDIPVIVEHQKDIITQVQIGFAKNGVVVVVRLGSFACSWPNIPGPYFDKIAFQIVVSELVEVNQGPAGTGKIALEIVEAIVALLHQWTPDGQMEPYKISADAFREQRDETYHVFFVDLATSGGLALTIPALEATGSLTGPVATLACVTPGAAIFYTLDGSGPAPRNGTLYTGPVTLTMGQTIKYRAWLAGYLPSPVASLGGA